jgi:hypothetical protein
MVLLLMSALSIAHVTIMDGHAASMPSLQVRCGKCRSRTRPPCRDTGPLRQHHGHSPAACGIPSFASRAATAGRATATAAQRRRCFSLATQHCNDDAVRTMPDRHGHIRSPWGGEGGSCVMWHYLIYIIVVGAVVWPGLVHSFLSKYYLPTWLT